MAIASPTRHNLVHRGQQLEYFTIVYNSAEGLVSIVAGIVAGSVSLIGFGLDSLIEVASGAALLWRLHYDLDHSRRERVERITLKIVGWCFVALAAYIVYESGSALIRHGSPERSIPGIIVAAVSVVVMPLLARAKREVAADGISDGISGTGYETPKRQRLSDWEFRSPRNTLGRLVDRRGFATGIQSFISVAWGWAASHNVYMGHYGGGSGFQFHRPRRKAQCGSYP